jgi:hypothetical protein
MIRLVGHKADGWLPSLGVLTREELRAGNPLIDSAALDAGRDPDRIRRVLNVQGLIGEGPVPSSSELRVGYLAGEPLGGPPEWWAETITGFVDGFDTIVSGRSTYRRDKSNCSPARSLSCFHGASEPPARERFRPEAGASRWRANADALPGIASTRLDTHLAAGSDDR